MCFLITRILGPLLILLCHCNQYTSILTWGVLQFHYYNQPLILLSSACEALYHVESASPEQWNTLPWNPWRSLTRALQIITKMNDCEFCWSHPISPLLQSLSLLLTAGEIWMLWCTTHISHFFKRAFAAQAWKQMEQAQCLGCGTVFALWFYINEEFGHMWGHHFYIPRIETHTKDDCSTFLCICSWSLHASCSWICLLMQFLYLCRFCLSSLLASSPQNHSPL